jgi:hypothetical protein
VILRIASALLLSLACITLNACAITAAAVTGAVVYSINNSSDHLLKSLKSQNPAGYFIVSLLHDNILLAGQVQSAKDKQLAENLAQSSITGVSVYSYLSIGAIESTQQQQADSLLQQQVHDIIKKYSATDFMTSAVTNKMIYLLVLPKQNTTVLNGIYATISQQYPHATLTIIQQQ